MLLEISIKEKQLIISCLEYFIQDDRFYHDNDEEIKEIIIKMRKL